MRWILVPLAAVAVYLALHFSAPPTKGTGQPLPTEAASEAGVQASKPTGSSALSPGQVDVNQARVAIEAIEADSPPASVGAQKPNVVGRAAKVITDQGRQVRFQLAVPEALQEADESYSVEWINVASANSAGELDLGVERTSLTTLPLGAYECVCKSESGLRGPVAGFEVSEGAEALIVELTAAATFKLRAIVQHDKTKALQPDVAVVMKRDDLTAFGETPSHELLTDTTGAIAFEDLTPGEWSFTLTLEGFAESRFTLNLPGRWADQLGELGHVDFGTLWMTPITPLRVELKGHGDWASGAQGFRIAAGPEEEPATFDAFGRTTVELGWISNPVYLKLFYPNEQRLGIYLDAGLPEPGEAIAIEIGRGRTLEIDVQAAPEIADLLDFEKSSFNVTGRTVRGDSVTQGASVGGLGVYRVEGVAASTVTVSFSTVMEERLTVMTSEPVTMKESGVTTCTLLIDSVPRRLKLKGTTWQPGTSTFAEVRPSPDLTSWLHGNPVDEAGCILLPDLKGKPHSLRLSDLEQRVLAVDIPITLPESQGTAEMTIAPPRTTRTRVLVDGVPTSGIPISYTGVDSTAVCAVEETGDDGWTPSWEVVEGSRLLAQPMVKGLWGARFPSPHPVGDLTIELHSTGVIRVPTAIHQDDIRRAGESDSLGDWVRESLVVSTSSTPLMHEYNVPIGQYSLMGADGSLAVFEIVKAAVTVVTQ